MDNNGNTMIDQMILDDFRRKISERKNQQQTGQFYCIEFVCFFFNKWLSGFNHLNFSSGVNCFQVMPMQSRYFQIAHFHLTTALLIVQEAIEKDNPYENQEE